MIEVTSFSLSFAGGIWYIKQMVSGKVQPERMTWFIWSAVMVLTFASYRSLGADSSQWFVAGDMLQCIVVFGFSLHYGRGGTSRLDLMALLVAGLGLAAWEVVGTPLAALAGAMIADISGVVQTVHKALHDPNSESWASFAMGAVAAFLGFTLIGKWDWSLMAYPLYLIAANAIIVFTVVIGQYHKGSRA